MSSLKLWEISFCKDNKSKMCFEEQWDVTQPAHVGHFSFSNFNQVTDKFVRVELSWRQQQKSKKLLPFNFSISFTFQCFYFVVLTLPHFIVWSCYYLYEPQFFHVLVCDPFRAHLAGTHPWVHQKMEILCNFILSCHPCCTDF